MINSVVLVGRLTKDIDLKYTTGGIAYARFTLAVNRRFTNQQGQREADFITCVAWRAQAENMAKYLQKGSLIGLDGSIQTSNFEGRDGNRVYMTDVVASSVQFLESRNSRTNQESDRYSGQDESYQHNQHSSPQTTQGNESDPFSNGQGPIDVSDDDLPF